MLNTGRQIHHPLSQFFIILLAAMFIFNAITLVVNAQEQQPTPLPTCTVAQIETAVLPPYVPTTTQGFVQAQGDKLVLLGEDYHIRGVNYYPVQYPWRRFLMETNVEEIPRELNLLYDAGLNSLRIFLWNEALFDCPGSGAVPNVDNFLRLDAIIHEAARQGFRLVITLNDMPDLEDYPLYTSPNHNQLQTNFIAQRYHDEAAIIAWDVRNGGDLDYSEPTPEDQRFDKQQVLDWLALTISQVRAADPNHLITAGWVNDTEATFPFVDIVSFQHRGDSQGLRQHIDELGEATDKPVMLVQFGYDTATFSLDQQASAIYADVQTAEKDNGVVGWFIWTAFDFPLNRTCIEDGCVSEDNYEHYFGLWKIDYTPKPAAGILHDLFGR